uniref:YbaB/EbfC family nucleoid-associated protein n=1 Tax=Escherichia coli TaxID=562 RepID=UPI0019162069
GGLVKVRASAKGRIIGIDIDESLLQPSEKQIVEDLVVAAFNDAKAFDPASGRVFKPSVIKEIGGHRVAIIGQAFPYVPIAHPKRFTPDWTFGIRDDELQKLVDGHRNNDKVEAVILLSHNGMD